MSKNCNAHICVLYFIPAIGYVCLILFYYCEYFEHIYIYCHIWVWKMFKNRLENVGKSGNKKKFKLMAATLKHYI